MDFSLFDSLKSGLAKTLAHHLENRVLSVPQEMVNLALDFYVEHIPELNDLRINVEDGRFSVYATGRKGIAFTAHTVFVVESCEASDGLPVIRLRQVSATSFVCNGLWERILMTVIAAVFSTMLRQDPMAYWLGGQAGLSVSGDLYTMDLGQGPLGEYMRRQAILRQMLQQFSLREIRCEPGRFLVLAGMRPDPAL